MQDTGLKGTDYVLRAFAFAISDWAQILIGMLPWMVPLIALDMWPVVDPDGYYGRVLAKQATFSASGNYHLGPGIAGWLFLLFVSWFEMAMLAGFAIRRHRRVLSLVMPMHRSLPAAIGPYVGYWLLTSLIAGFLGVMGVLIISLFARSPVSGIVPYMIFVLIAAIGMFILRSVLIFPAIAVGDREMTIRTSFDVTHRSVWRMAISVVLIAIPLIVVALLVGLVLDKFVPQVPWWRFVLVVAIFMQVIQFFGTAVFIAYISLVYAHKRGGDVPAPPDWDKTPNPA